MYAYYVDTSNVRMHNNLLYMYCELFTTAPAPYKNHHPIQLNFHQGP